MKPIAVIGSHPGRVLIAADAGPMTWGLRRGDSAGRAVAAGGLVPLREGADVCLLGPLVGGPLDGETFVPTGAGPRRSSAAAPLPP